MKNDGESNVVERGKIKIEFEIFLFRDTIGP